MDTLTDLFRRLLQIIDERIAAALANIGVVGTTLPIPEHAEHAATADDADTLDGQHAAAFAPAASAHDPVTLDANAGAVLGLSTQEIGLDTQAANSVFAGPATGAAAAPTFRTLGTADLPAGIDADTVDGLHAATSGADAHVLATDADGDISVVGIYAERIWSSDDLRAKGGIIAGAFDINPADGDIIAIGDVRVGSGIYVGGTGSGAAFGEITTISHITTGGQLKSTVATGTAPLSVNSTTVCTNLNADRIDGYHASTTGAASSVPVTDANGSVKITGGFYAGGASGYNLARYLMNSIVNLADDATVNLIGDGALGGLYYVYCTSDGQSCLFIVTSSVTIISDPAGQFVTTDTDGRHCLLISGTDLQVKNRRGVNRSYRCHKLA